MKLGFIGLGNMAGTICKGVIESGFIKGEDVCGFDINQEKLLQMKETYGIQICENERDLVKHSDYVLMGVKPNVIESVLDKVKDLLENKTIISIVAGYSHEKYESLIPGTHHLTIMPNTPARVFEGVTLFEKENTLDKEEFDFAYQMFESIGEVYVIDNKQMVAGGALSGCGPAFVYMFIEALADGAVLNGLPRDLAYKLASQTVLGSAKMVQETGMHPGILKDQVCSPGGITIKGVKALEENGFRNAVMEAIDKAK